MSTAMPSIPYRKALVIANPIAGRGRGERNATELAAALARAGVACDVHLTCARGDGGERAARLERDVDLAIAIGGDGTLSEVLHGLPRRDLAVAVLPMGTANVLSLDLRLPRDVAGFVRLLANGRTQRLDTAMVNGSMLSFLVCGVGFDALVTRELERRRRGPITKRDWIAAGLAAIRAWDAPRLSIEIDGARVDGDYGQVLVSNIIHYAGFDVLAHDRVLDDGLFEVYAFAGSTRLSILRHLLRGALGRFPMKGVTLQRARRVRVTADRPTAFQIDGDFRGETPFELVVGSQPFHVLVP